ncbi:MAG: b-lactamase [Parcubacteria bacterium C7867-006]|nr:MAG: b-lactamase [Parcubacteria bacterium C7867-006]
MKNYNQILIGIVICIALEFVVYNLNHKYHFFTPIFESKISRLTEKHEGGGVFTSPLLECSSDGGDGIFDQIKISKPEMINFVNTLLAKNKVDFISVYIRDLNNGPWIGINEKEEFIGSSLLKVPILISYMKLAEDDKSILDKKIKYTTKILSDDQYYPSEKVLEVGGEYTVNELLEYMTYYSDNNAADLLAEEIDDSKMDKVFEALGLGKPQFNVPYPVNVRNYAGFFRILFNASYVNKEYSEKTLEMLSRTKFDRGLTALLPKNIVVSHKFGIRSDNGLNQLHDCGIVYYPDHPYLICVMSRGGSFEDLSSAIAQISEFVYNQVNNNHY